VIARRRFPEAGVLARARALLLDAGIEVPIASWSSLATLYDTPWLPAGGRPSAATRIVRRRMRLLGTAPTEIGAAHAAPRGELVHLRGVVAPLPGAAPGPIWRVSAAMDEFGVWLVEEAVDFLLAGEHGSAIRVVVEGGHLLDAQELQGGEAVAAFGVIGDLPDDVGVQRSPHGRGGTAPVLRSGTELPLLICRVVR
jgi:hypothetical protein